MDSWDELSHLEETFEASGFEEGLAFAAEQQHNDGFQIGLNAGQKVGEEIGFYEGIVQRCLAHTQDHPEDTKVQKQKKHLAVIQGLLKEFPRVNVIGVDTEGILCKIRLRYQMAMAMMGLTNETRYPPVISEEATEKQSSRVCAPTNANQTLSF